MLFVPKMLGPLVFVLASNLWGDVGQPILLDLWEGNPPGFIANAGAEKTFPQWPETVAHVSIPAISVYLPPKDQASGMALVYCSGGSYSKVSIISDAIADAGYFCSRGVAVIVVKYRTTPPAAADYSDALADGQRAMRLVRHHAADWGIDPNRIGMLGGSAGANLILNAATHSDPGQPDAADPIERQSCRPDFIVLLCPWPGQQSAVDFPIDAQTPPALIGSVRDDEIAPTAFAEGIAAEYRKAGVPAHLMTLESGGHAAFEAGAAAAEWKTQLWRWLAHIGIWER